MLLVLINKNAGCMFCSKKNRNHVITGAELSMLLLIKTSSTLLILVTETLYSLEKACLTLVLVIRMGLH